jgi:hypothetical protein
MGRAVGPGEIDRGGRMAGFGGCDGSGEIEQPRCFRTGNGAEGAKAFVTAGGRL